MIDEIIQGIVLNSLLSMESDSELSIEIENEEVKIEFAQSQEHLL